MEELVTQIKAAQGGDLAAYGAIVRRFQDMAYGCAYAVLGDFHLAEDAAQEAFIEAYRKLGDLREPKAFPGWFRKVVLKHCDRFTRKKRVETVPLDEAAEVHASTERPDRAAERIEMKDRVLAAIQSLPESQRMATTLFYINGYSHNEVADFLEVPVSTVKKRLHDSRRKLKERMVGMVANALKETKPDKHFAQRLPLLLRSQDAEPLAMIPILEKRLSKIERKDLPLILSRDEQAELFRSLSEDLRQIYCGADLAPEVQASWFHTTIHPETNFVVFFRETKDGTSCRGVAYWPDGKPYCFYDTGLPEPA